MELKYWKEKLKNFGDDLNGWLWPQIFENIDNENNVCFLGIGTILNKKALDNIGIDNYEKKIVFGSGVRPDLFRRKLTLDNTWDVKFLRGPLSSEYFDNKYDYITDSAYAIRQLDSFSTLMNHEKKYEVSFMPYFHSLQFIDWETICEELGFHYISPFADNGIENTLIEIASSKKLIAEAMHGAIVADLFRVPWQRFIFSTYYHENPYISDYKWNDWLLSVGLENVNPIRTPIYTNSQLVNFVMKQIKRTKLIPQKSKFIQRDYLIREMENNKAFYCSNDEQINIIDAKIANKIKEL